MNRNSIVIIVLLLMFSLMASPADAIKKKYDKASGITRYSSPQMAANFGFFSGNVVWFNCVAVHSEEKNATKAFFVFQAMQKIPTITETTPLYLLLDNAKRIEIMPVTATTHAIGGTGTYWGFGVSSYRTNNYMEAVYEFDAETLNQISSANRLDGSVAGFDFDIKKSEIMNVKKVIKYAIEEPKVKGLTLKPDPPATR